MFLPEAVRASVRREIERHLERIGAVVPSKPNRDKHRSSEYILKGLLRAKQGNLPMTGRRTGKVASKVRYYAVSRATSVPRSRSIQNRMIQAQPLECAVINCLREVLPAKPDLTRAIQRAVEGAARPADGSGSENLEKELKRKRRQLVLLVDQVAGGRRG